MDNPSVGLCALATATPPNRLVQDEVARASHTMFADRFPGYARMAAVFETSGIHQRFSAKPLDWFLTERGWPERTAAYLETAGALFITCATKALADAGLRADEIDTVVTVSSTGIATPSLEARAHHAMGFRTDIKRVPVFGLGCAGGVTGVGIASRLAAAAPGSKVLLVVVELCTLSFRYDQLTKANVVATALFGDGAAAAIFSTTGPAKAHVVGAGEHLWPDTLDIMGWDVDPQGFGVIFAQAIPGFATRNMKGGVDAILAGLSLTRSDVDRFICHPGGAKVIKAIESSLDMAAGTLDHERDILADHGNMSAPTVLFVLEQALKAGLPTNAALLALGPGFTASCAVLRAA